MNRNRNKVIKYKGRYKDQNNLIVNPDLYEPAISQKNLFVKDNKLVQNNRNHINNQSATKNYFTKTLELDAKIKHKKQRIGD
ncbi:MAG: hypothetical protein ACFFD2_25800 [Promethearchaeota archaeon]